MKKRWICGFLATLLLLGLLPLTTLKANAGSQMHVSDALVNILKQYEGFSPVCVKDNSQRSVGYGTRCDVCDPNASSYPNKQTCSYTEETPITEEKATQLFRNFLTDFEQRVNSFCDKYDLKLSQNQFDALVSFTYNLGPAWLSSSSSWVQEAVRSGATGTEFIYAMCLHSRSGQDYLTSLIRRRRSEANMFLNGVYDIASPDYYKYVYLDGNGGLMENIIHGYDLRENHSIIYSFSEIPTGVDETGKPFIYEFAGWYTSAQGGTKVETLDGSLANGTVLYARWKNPVTGQIDALPKGEVLEPLEIVTTAKRTVYAGPGTFYAKNSSATLASGDKATVTETFVYRGSTWGKVENGWIDLTYTNFEDALTNREMIENPEWPKNGTVNGTNVNVRGEPTTSGEKKYQLNTGDKVVISETVEADGYVWGKLADGNWIALKYVILESSSTAASPAPTVTGITVLKGPDKTDYVQMQDCLNRQGIIIQINYSDGSIGAKSPTRSEISGFSNATLGENTVTVTYSQKTATFKVNIVKATVTFLNYDGTLLSSAQYAYGETVTVPTPVQKPADEAGEYVFVGWDRPVTTCAGDTTYKAVFDLYVEPPPTTEPPETTDPSEPPETTVPGETTQPSEPPETTEPPVTTEPTEPPTEPPAPQYLLGDVDDNGVVNDRDAIHLLWHTLFAEEYPVTGPADLNGDGVVNDRDAIYLLWHTLFKDEYPLIDQ